MGLFFEHESIRRALISSGLLQVHQQLDSGSTTRPVFFAWTSKELLLLQPANVWLCLEESVFVQLPQSYETVQHYLDQSALPVVESEALQRLRTPLGQWLRSLSEFPHTPDRMKMAASELQRFAGKHWPGWYDAILANIVLEINKGKRPDRGLCLLAEQAARVAAMNAVTPLTDWLTDQSKAEHIHTLEEVLAYSQQGLLDPGEARLNLEWLDLLTNDCAKARLELALSAKVTDDQWSDLEELIHSTSQSLSELRSLDHLQGNANIRKTQMALDQLNKALTGMMCGCETVKDSLSHNANFTDQNAT